MVFPASGFVTLSQATPRPNARPKDAPPNGLSTLLVLVLIAAGYFAVEGALGLRRRLGRRPRG